LKYNEKIRKAYGIEVKTVTEGFMTPRMIITIDGISTQLLLTREHLEDLKWQKAIDRIKISIMIDDEIEGHPNFKKIIRTNK